MTHGHRSRSVNSAAHGFSSIQGQHRLFDDDAELARTADGARHAVGVVADIRIGQQFGEFYCGPSLIVGEWSIRQPTDTPLRRASWVLQLREPHGAIAGQRMFGAVDGQGSATVDEDLVQLLLLELAPHGSCAAHDAGALPLLSHALLQTWQRGTRRRMTVLDYNAVGRIGGAIQRSADAVYSDLTTPQRQIARRTFLRLVTIDEESVTRRRVHRSELFFDDDTAADVNAVIDRFCAQRLLTCEEETVEITHEAVIGAWNRLSDWVDSDRGGLIVRRRLTHAAQVWHDSGCDPGELLGPARLPLVQEWTSTGGRHRDLNQRERDYLAASSAEQQAAILAQRRRTRISRLVGAIVGGGLTSRLRYSLTQVGHTLPTWPQLGTAATMAGAVGALAARLIACGGGLRSGRYRVDLDELLLGVSAVSTSS